jgi:dephospho-CoA kinase
MLRIVITGGIACGKSLVASFLTGKGVAVCDSDDVARSLMQPGQDVFEKVVSTFGDDIVADDGAIDRAKLAQRVFGDRSQLSVLNGLVHPEVKRAWRAWLQDCEKQGCAAAAVVVPLLYEVGEEKGWDAIVCVGARQETQLERLKGRGMSIEEAEKRIRAQMKVATKMGLADYVIHNDGTEDLLKQQTMKVIGNILEKKHGNEK